MDEKLRGDHDPGIGGAAGNRSLITRSILRSNGSVTIPIGGIPLISGSTLTFLTAGVDEAQRLHILGTATATGSGSAFGISAFFDIPFSISASTNGVTLTLAPTLAGAPTVVSDVSIAWWVYLAGTLTGGSLIATVLIAIDLFGGLFLNGPLSSLITTALGGSIPSIPVPISGPGLPPIVTSVSSVSLNQADALVRTFPVPGGVSVPDGFRQHDLIVTMA